MRFVVAFHASVALSDARPRVTASRGRVSGLVALPTEAPGCKRVQFDLSDVQGEQAVELGLRLERQGKVASEVWAYPYVPAEGARKVRA